MSATLARNVRLAFGGVCFALTLATLAGCSPERPLGATEAQAAEAAPAAAEEGCGSYQNPCSLDGLQVDA